MADRWSLTDHACRHCMGRVLRSERPDGADFVACAECGAEADGEPDRLCWCGVEMASHGRVFECFTNPAPSVTVPQKVLVRERKQPRSV